MNSKDQTKGISFFEQCRGLLSRSLEYDPRIPFIFRLNPQRRKPPSLRHSVCLFSLRKLRRPTWCHLGEPNFVPTSPLNPALLLPTTDISNRYSISVGRNYSGFGGEGVLRFSLVFHFTFQRYPRIEIEN